VKLKLFGVLVHSRRVSREFQWRPRRRRGRVDIIADVLNIAVEGATKTRILRDANLSHLLLEKYLAETVSIGLLQPTSGVYVTSAKGRQFLELYVWFSAKQQGVQKGLGASRLELGALERMCSRVLGRESGLKES
jgi:predicted transcriptional regulator